MKHFFRFSIGISLIFCCCNFSSFKNTFQTEGLIQERTYFINFEDSTQLPYTKLESNIWFQDSCLIIEMKKINNHFNNDSLVKSSYDFHKYVYFDLRSMTCQDYWNFSDTALPFTNYYLKNNEGVTGQFYRRKSPKDVSDSVAHLSDTIIQNKAYKRIWMFYKADKGSNNYETVYYLDCNTKSNIFQINKTLDEKFTDCQVTKRALRPDLNSPLAMILEYNVLKSELSLKEKEVFRKWSKNAKETELPLLTFMEAMKISVDMDKKKMIR